MESLSPAESPVSVRRSPRLLDYGEDIDQSEEGWAIAASSTSLLAFISGMILEKFEKSVLVARQISA